MIKIKVTKYKKGYVLSVGIDPDNPIDLPTSIFRNNDVIDPIYYFFNHSKPPGSTNSIYVKQHKLDEILHKIKDFYKKFSEYYDINIKIKIYETQEITTTDSDIEKITLTRKPTIKTLTPADILDTIENTKTTEKKKIQRIIVTKINKQIPVV